MPKHYEYTEGQMTYIEEQIESELKKFKLPPITRAYKTWGIPLFNRTLIPFSFFIVALFMIYSGSVDAPEWTWILCEISLPIYVLFFGIFSIISNISEKISTVKFRRKMKLSKKDFNIFCVTYNITGL